MLLLFLLKCCSANIEIDNFGLEWDKNIRYDFPVGRLKLLNLEKPFHYIVIVYLNGNVALLNYNLFKESISIKFKYMKRFLLPFEHDFISSDNCERFVDGACFVVFGYIF